MSSYESALAVIDRLEGPTNAGAASTDTSGAKNTFKATSPAAAAKASVTGPAKTAGSGNLAYDLYQSNKTKQAARDFAKEMSGAWNKAQRNAAESGLTAEQFAQKTAADYESTQQQTSALGRQVFGQNADLAMWDIASMYGNPADYTPEAKQEKQDWTNYLQNQLDKAKHSASVKENVAKLAADQKQKSDAAQYAEWAQNDFNRRYDMLGSYGKVYDDYNKTIDELEALRADYEEKLKAAQKPAADMQSRLDTWDIDSMYNPGSDIYSKEAKAKLQADLAKAKAESQADIEAYSKMRDDITRQISREKSLRDYAGNMLTKDQDAANYVNLGAQKEQALLAQHKQQAQNEAMLTSGSQYTANNTSYRTELYMDLHPQPREGWTSEQIDNYLYRLGKYGEESAADYAASINTAIKDAKKAPQHEAIQEYFAAKGGSLTEKIYKGLAAYGTKLISFPSSVLSYAQKMDAVASTDHWTGRDDITFAEASRDAIAARAGQIGKDYPNLKFKDNIPVIGGKGIDDVYQLGGEAIRSVLQGGAAGAAGSLAMMFFDVADAEFDEAKANGASDEMAAILANFKAGVEVATEYLPLENLLNGNWSKNFTGTLAKQVFEESAEEAAGGVMDLVAEEIAASITGERTQLEKDIDALVVQGMDRNSAGKKVFKDTVDDLAWQAIGGGLTALMSGGALGAPQAIAQTGKNKLYDIQQQRAAEKSKPTEGRGSDAINAGTNAAQTQRETMPANPLYDSIRQRTGNAVDALKKAEEAARAQESEITPPASQHAAEAVKPQESEALSDERAAQAEADSTEAELARAEERFNELNDILDQEAYSEEERPAIESEYERLYNRLPELRAKAQQRAKQKADLKAQQERVEAGKVSKDFGTPENHIDNRTSEGVADRSVKAFQFDHPELHDYYVDAAKQLSREVETAEAEAFMAAGRKGGADYRGPISRLLDMGMTKPRIMKCLQDIIQNNGAENYADAKRVELALNDMLTNGWTGMNREYHEGNAGYIAAKESINGAVKADSWEKYLADRQASIADGLVTEDELRAEWEAQQREASAEPPRNTLYETVAEREAEKAPAEKAPTQSESEESTAVNTNPTEHTPEEQAVIEEYQAAVDEDLAEYVEGIKRNGGAGQSRYYLEPVSEHAAEDIERITGVQTSGNKTVIEPRIIEHILKRHGENGSHDHSMADVNDIARIQYVLDNYDSVSDGGTSTAYQTVKPNGKSGAAKTVKFAKKVNGTYYVVEAVPNTKAKTVFVVSAYMSKNAGASQTATAPATGAMRGTSETKNANPPASSEGRPLPVNTVSQDQGEVKGENSLLSGEGTTEERTNGRGPERERGMAESARTSENTNPDLAQSLEDNRVFYRQLTNAEVEEKANKIISQGFEAALQDVREKIAQAKIGKKFAPEYVVAGYDCANELAKRGRVAEARELAADIAAEVTWGGQVGQIVRLLLQADPSVRIRTVEKITKKLNDKLTARQRARNVKSGTGTESGDIRVSDEALQRYANAETDAEADAALDAIQQEIADQIPPTFMDRFTAMRYLNMLGNLKTQGRNIVGNAAMFALTNAKYLTQHAMELAAASKGDYQMNTALNTSAEQRQWAAEDYEAHKEEIGGERRYSDTSRQAMKGIEDKKQVFGKTGNLLWDATAGRMLEKYRLGTQWAMQYFDDVFIRQIYIRSFAGWMKAHNIANANEATVEQVNAARQFAAKEAQEATFHDSNRVSDAVSGFLRGPNTGPIMRAIGEGVAPFRRTPANVAVRAVEYSPLGILETIYKGIQAKNGNATAADVINSAAKNVTGSVLFIAGMLAQAAGKARARGDEDDEKLTAFEKQQGRLDYSIRVGDRDISLSQFAPSAIPFFMGVKLGELQEYAGDFSLDDIGKIAGVVTDPMLEMSMLSGVNDFLNNLSSAYGDSDAVTSLVANAMLSYLTQGITNSLLGQMEQYSEKNRQTTYTDTKSEAATALDRLLGKNQYKVGQMAAKIPGIDYNQQDYIDAWGRTQSNGGAGERAFNAFLNPTYTGKNRSTDVDKELERLHAENKGKEGFPEVLPQKRSRSSTIGDGIVMTPDEYLEFSKDAGQKKYSLVSEFINSKEYKDLNDQQRAEVIHNLYEFADATALQKVRDARGIEASNKWSKVSELGNVPAYMAATEQFKTEAEKSGTTFNGWNNTGFEKYISSGLDSSDLDVLAESSLTERRKPVYDLMRESGMSPREYADAISIMDGEKKDQAFKQSDVYDWLVKQDQFTEEQKNQLWDLLGNNWKTSYSQYKPK